MDTDGTLSDLRPRGLLQRFNAIDFNALVGGEFMEAPPDNANRTSNGFSDYLWLFEKSTVAGGSGEGASRKVAVLKVISVENSEISNLVDLTYQRLVGVDFSDELPVASAQTFFTNEDTPTGITLEGIDADTCELTFIIESGPDNGSLTDILNNPCVPGDPNGDSASVIYSPDLNFNGVDNFTYIVIDGNGDDIATITVTIEVVNDPPSFIAGQSLVISDEDVPYSDTWATVINAGPDNEFGQLLTFDVTNNNPPLFSAPPAIAADGTPELHTSSQRPRHSDHHRAVTGRRWHGQGRCGYQRSRDLHHYHQPDQRPALSAWST